MVFTCTIRPFDALLGFGLSALREISCFFLPPPLRYFRLTESDEYEFLRDSILKNKYLVGHKEYNLDK